MELKTYLTKMLGKRKANRVLRAVSDARPILITGPRIATGKTTLCEVLRKAGAPAFERWEAYEINLSKPLEELVPHFEDQVEIPQKEREWRRFELCCDGAERAELYALLDRLHLTRRELALIVSGLRVRPEFSLEDFGT
mgnify:FL=1